MCVRWREVCPECMRDNHEPYKGEEKWVYTESCPQRFVPGHRPESHKSVGKDICQGCIKRREHKSKAKDKRDRKRKDKGDKKYQKKEGDKHVSQAPDRNNPRPWTVK